MAGWGRRLKGALVRSVAKQVADAVAFLHSAGYVHGGACGWTSSPAVRFVNSLAVGPDLTSSNVLFQVSDTLRHWSDEDVHRMLGELWTEDVCTYDGTLPEPAAPRAVVEAAELSCLALSNLLLKDNPRRLRPGFCARGEAYGLQAGHSNELLPAGDVL
jgi:hypothetical protein